MPTVPDPHQHLPLRHVEFEILLVLARGPSHGYGIIKEAEERSAGALRLETGTLYRALRRLVSTGLVEPVEERPAPEADDERRSYYAITPFGLKVAAAEARRLAAQVEVARARELLTGAHVRGGAS